MVEWGVWKGNAWCPNSVHSGSKKSKRWYNQVKKEVKGKYSEFIRKQQKDEK
jgi:hypothetical protein